MAEQDIIFWYWWVLSVGFLALEIIVTGFFFLWLAVAAFIVGLEYWLIPSTSFDVQLFLFSVLAVSSILGWRHYARTRKVEKTDHPFLNKRGAQYVGRTFTLVAPIENGHGKIKIGDSLWLVQGEDCPLGTKVKVVAVKGTVFEVEIYR
jgi:inner membrane protein